MNIQATAPCVHFYTANWIINVKGKGGFVYQPRSTLSLETQGYPDAVNHPKFPSTIVNPGKTYAHSVVYFLHQKIDLARILLITLSTSIDFCIQLRVELMLINEPLP